MAVVILLIASHYWEQACFIAAFYALWSSLFLSTFYFVVGFVKTKHVGLDAQDIPARANA
jgi:hypothetical protein